MKEDPSDAREDRTRDLEKLKTRMLSLVEDLTDVEKAGMAGALMSDTDPTREVLEAFFDNLDDTTHTELCTRAADQEERDGD